MAEEQSGQKAKFYFSLLDGFVGEELEAFCAIMCKYFIQRYKINALNDKDLFIGLIRNHLEIDNFLQEISQYSPVEIGLFKIDGLPVGVELVNIGTQEEPVWEEQGTPLVEFNSIEYISLMPDEHTYDGDGEILTTTRPTVARPLSGFAGWKIENMR